jgi:hypothetical protein
MTSGMPPAWAAREAFSRNVSAELAAQGIRGVCLGTTSRTSDLYSSPTRIVFDSIPCNLPLFLRDELNLDQAANGVAHV